MPFVLATYLPFNALEALDCNMYKLSRCTCSEAAVLATHMLKADADMPTNEHYLVIDPNLSSTCVLALLDL